MYAKCFYLQPGGCHFTFGAFSMMKERHSGGLKTNTDLEGVNTPLSLAPSLLYSLQSQRHFLIFASSQ